MRLDQAKRLGDIELLGRKQNGRHAARGLHELVNAGAMRQRRHHQRGIGLRGTRHQVGEMVGDDEGHLAMGQHGRLGTSGGARSEEEPAGIVVVDRRILDLDAGLRRDHVAHGALAKTAVTDPPDEFERRIGRRHRVIRKVAMAQEGLGAGGAGEIGDLIRHQAEIGRHPHRAEPERREHRPEHLVAVFGMNQDAFALDYPTRGEAGGERRHGSVDLAPSPGFVAPDEADTVAMAAGILGQEMA